VLEPASGAQPPVTTTRRPALKTFPAITVALALALGVTACSSDDPPGAGDRTTTTAKDTTTTSADGGSTTTAPGDALVNVEVDPGLSEDDFVGARQDVTVDKCEHGDDGWVASGEVTNSSGSDASYRIYVALNVEDSTVTKALVQVNASVTDGDTAPWEVTIPLDEPDGLTCILRVERVAA
jgi:hypothetical protein